MSAIEAMARAIMIACDEDPDARGDARGNEFRWQDCAEDLVIPALRAAEEAGWRLVPVGEPTPEMERQVNAACGEPDADLGWTYREWIEAAPRPWEEKK